MLHDKVDGIPGLAAAEALKNLLRRRNGEGGCFFVVKGTEPEIIDASFFQRNEFLDHIHNLCGIKDPFYCLAVDHGSKIGKNGATVQWCNGATVQGYNGATVQRYNGAMVQWCSGAMV